jgi:hypothetical protein
MTIVCTLEPGDVEKGMIIPDQWIERDLPSGLDPVEHQQARYIWTQKLVAKLEAADRFWTVRTKRDPVTKRDRVPDWGRPPGIPLRRRRRLGPAPHPERRRHPCPRAGPGGGRRPGLRHVHVLGGRRPGFHLRLGGQ